MEASSTQLEAAKGRSLRRHMQTGEYATPQERALAMLVRHEQGETIPDIAKSLKITHQAAYKFLLTHCPTEWKASQVARAVATHEQAKAELEKLKKSKGDARAQVALACAREALRSAQWELERLFSDLYGPKSHVTVENVGDLAERLRRAKERVVPQDVVDAEIVRTQKDTPALPIIPTGDAK